MTISGLLSVGMTHFPASDLLMENGLLFSMIILILALSVILRSAKFFLIQLMLVLLVMMVGNIAGLSVLFIFLQFLLTGTVLYKLKQAIDYNYTLIQEKTHQQKRSITTNGYNGATHSFLM